MASRIVKYPVSTTVTPDSVTYHKTEVLTFHPDGSISVRTGGWRTKTTAHRINQFGRGVGAFIRRGEFFITWQGEEYPMKEGIRCYPNGDVK